jgi:hypothetical protein
MFLISLYVYACCTPALPLRGKVVPGSREILEEESHGNKEQERGKCKNK